MNILKHCYYAIRYGEWDWGWDMWKEKHMFGFYHTYYDGNWVYFHFYKLWFGVNY